MENRVWSNETNVNEKPETGKVFLVGAGPGDPRLITLRGAELLAQADVVMYDGLVNPLLLELTAGRLERTARTRSTGQPTVPQHAINQQLITEAQAGRCVVRLKGGDPYIFGRGSEEARALAQAGIPFEVVPGITAATAAGVYAGFSFTHREHSSAVAFVTGHETPERETSHLDYASLAGFPGTLVFYMGLARIRTICRQLVENGKPAEAPAAVVSHATLPDQQVVCATLQDLPDEAEKRDLHAPSLIVIGECVNQRDVASWFETLPLFGLRIGITRPEHQASEVVESVTRMGGQPVVLPLIEILPPDDSQLELLQQSIRDLDRFDWLLFTSANAVQGFMEQLWKCGDDARSLRHLRIAAVGSATASKLEEWMLRPDVTSDGSPSEAFVELLAPEVEGKKCLWPSADRARTTLRRLLEEAGAEVQQVVTYRHRDVEPSDEGLSRCDASTLHWIGLSSPAIAAQAARLFPELRAPDNKTRIVTISNLTTEAARQAGLTVSAESKTSSWAGMLQAVATAETEVASVTAQAHD